MSTKKCRKYGAKKITPAKSWGLRKGNKNMYSVCYPKIETIFNRDEKSHKVKVDDWKNEIYPTISLWGWTEKIDGTNIRIMWDSAKKELVFGGKTEKAHIPKPLLEKLQSIAKKDIFEAIFPKKDVIVFGEGYGNGIQYVGSQYSSENDFSAFDVLVGGKFWLNWDNTVDVCNKLGIKTVPYIGGMSLYVASERTREGFKSNIGTCLAEGMIGRPLEPIFDSHGNRIIVKIKTVDFD